MALPLFTFCPEFGAREIRAPRTSPVKFGNGKERRYRFGLITDLRTWELSFDYNTDTRREQILAFLEERGAWKVFEWTDPKGYFGRWRCKEWRTTWNGHRQQTITCTFLEVDERAAVAGEPPADGLADMWVSRVTTDIDEAFIGNATMCSDGSTYQAAWIREAGDIGVFQVYVFRRSVDGVLLWQKKFADYDAARRPMYVARDNNDNFYIAHQRNTAQGSTDNRTRIRIYRINANSSLAWQYEYTMDIATSSGGNFNIQEMIYDEITNRLYLAGTRAVGLSTASADAGIVAIDVVSGDIVASRSIIDLLVQPSGQLALVDTPNLVVRQARLWYSAVAYTNTGAGGTSQPVSVMIEFSLDLAAVFTSWRYTQTRLGIPHLASNGSWYVRTADRAIKLSASGAVEWMQIGPASTSYWINGGRVSPGAIHRSETNTNKIVWTRRTGGGLSVVKYDHELALQEDYETELRCFRGSSPAAPPNLILNIDEQKKIAFAHASSHTGSNDVQGFRVIAYGGKTEYEDEITRNLDAGQEIDSNFRMTAKTHIDQSRIVSTFDEPINWPSQNNYTHTFGAFTATREDLNESWVNGVLSIAYYAYSDPEFTPPSESGSASLVFFAGNGSAQKISATRLFTPAFLIIANRATSNRKSFFNTFFDPRFYQGWNGTRTSIASDNDGLSQLGQGFFKIGGTLDSVNRSSNNFVAFALGTIAGAHEIVSYTGTGAIQTISHSLGATPSFVLFQRDGSGITLAGTALGGAGINYNPGSSTGTVTSSTSYVRAINSSSVEIGTISALNASGDQYRMHVFQSSDDWTIDNVSGPGTGTFTVSLGFQPKAILFKGATGVGTAWQLLYRVDGTTGIAKSLPLNAGSAVEADSAFASITADGFTILQGGPGNTGSSSAFYLAIK
jgi:phage-related protein